jgi:uncharacterized protein YaaW (UPF0174 family)
MKNVPKKPEGKKSLLKVAGPRIGQQHRQYAGNMIKRFMKHYGFTKKEATRAVVKELQKDTIIEELFGGPNR